MQNLYKKYLFLIKRKMVSISYLWLVGAYKILDKAYREDQRMWLEHLKTLDL